MDPCITGDLKAMLLNMIDKKTPHEIMKVGVEALFPVCQDKSPATTAKGTSTRTFAAQWPKAIFIDENGQRHDEGLSASKLYTQLTGKETSGSISGADLDICNEEGKCYPSTLLESFRAFGYHIQGNGEPAPASDPESMLKSSNINRQATIQAHNVWKEHLVKSGKKLVIIHPDWIKKQNPE